MLFTMRVSRSEQSGSRPSNWLLEGIDFLQKPDIVPEVQHLHALRKLTTVEFLAMLEMLDLFPISDRDLY
jgi:hypothetical protein